MRGASDVGAQNVTRLSEALEAPSGAARVARLYTGDARPSSGYAASAFDAAGALGPRARATRCEGALSRAGGPQPVKHSLPRRGRSSTRCPEACGSRVGSERSRCRYPRVVKPQQHLLASQRARCSTIAERGRECRRLAAHRQAQHRRARVSIVGRCTPPLCGDRAPRGRHHEHPCNDLPRAGACAP